jgi:hypothetical protein
LSSRTKTCYRKHQKQIAAIDQKIQFLEKKPSKQFVLHQKKRRCEILRQRLKKVEGDVNQKGVRLCFGGKKLFNAKFHLKKNGFSSYEECRSSWEERRNSEFFIPIS